MKHYWKSPNEFFNSNLKREKPVNPVNGFQGDVIFIATDYIKFKDIKPEKENILAYGEVTGHKHQVIEGDVELFQPEGSSDKFLRVYSDYAKVAHEEHNTVTIPKGDYIIRIAREYNYEMEEQRSVVD